MHISDCVHYPSWPPHSFFRHQCTSLHLYPLSLMTPSFLPFLINSQISAVVSIIHHDPFIYSFLSSLIHISAFVSIIHHDLFRYSFLSSLMHISPFVSIIHRDLFRYSFLSPSMHISAFLIPPQHPQTKVTSAATCAKGISSHLRRRVIVRKWKYWRH